MVWAFLTETMETGDKNPDDFMQMSLVMNMRVFSAMTEMMHFRVIMHVY